MFSHLNDQNNPHMVSISDKAITKREAKAYALVRFPKDVLAQFRVDDELRGPKGPVFQTAIIAGIMAVKNTPQLIPLCHPLPIDGCDIACEIIDEETVRVDCVVRTTHKTGVEMEALVGANLAALTIYDMCKALSHDIVIERVALISKKGGKSDYGLA